MNSQQQWRFVGSIPENYERYLVPSIFGPWAEDLVEMAALRRGERVLDIACGTGIVARTAARKLAGSGSVVGKAFRVEVHNKIAISRSTIPVSAVFQNKTERISPNPAVAASK